MTPRKHKAPRVDPDDYFGFELPHMHASAQHGEYLLLLGLDQLAIALYFMCLLPFAEGRANDVSNASYHRFIAMRVLHSRAVQARLRISR